MRPWPVILVLVAAGASWWLAEDGGSPGEADAGETGGIDYTISGLEVTRMTPTGRPAHRLQASEIEHFVDDDTTRLASPRLTVFQDDEPPWEVRAESALASADGELILLSGAVRIEREAGSSNPPVQIDTRELRLQPHQDYAETDEHVRVVSDSSWLDATGMQAWLRPPSRLKFLSEVKGYYEPQTAVSD